MNIERPMTDRLFPVDEYLYFLGRILCEIRRNGAVPVFATTVPILPEDKAKVVLCGGAASHDYTNQWVTEYNKAAVDFMNKEGVLVNDLYSLCLEDPFYYKCPDLLHLTDEGYRRCAEQVASVIRKAAEEQGR